MPPVPDDRPRVRIDRPAELLSAVPYLIGFHPTDSLVVVGLRGSALHFAVRADLPARGDPPGEVTSWLAEVVRRQHVATAIVVGYGDPQAVTPAVDTLAGALTGLGVAVFDALRVTGRRYWSYTCAEPACCPPEGTPFDPESSLVAAEATVAGLVALPDRDALADRVAPIGEPGRGAMLHATARARARLAAASPDKARLLALGRAAVDEAVTAHARGDRLDDDAAAWLSVLLRSIAVRDAAWQRIDRMPRDTSIPLWTDITRRAAAGYVSAPATLAAWAAYSAGDGALASVTLERALADDPAYPLAHLLREAIVRGIPPGALRGRRAARRRHRPGRGG